MTVCCVDDCGLTANDDVILFEFPTSRLQRKRWLDAINPRSKIAEDARICSKHFSRQDYEEIRGKTRLKGKVIPTRFGKQIESQDETSQESETLNDNKNKSHDNKNDNHNHNDNDIFNHTDNTDKSDSDTDYDIIPRKRKKGKQKRGRNNRNKTKKTRNDNKISDNHEHDISNKNDTNDKLNDNKINDSDKHNDIDNSKINDYNNLENGHNENISNRERDKSPSSMPADIEDIISKYQIENKKTERQLAAMAQELLMQAAEPVFIEMQVSQGPQEPPSNDCLMVLESVQVEVDPSLLLEAREEDEECMEQIDLDSADEKEPPINKKPDPISLLTSSDEDDVILQEPHIDTVEVSDETDEDDVPLVKLVKTDKQDKRKKQKKSMIGKILMSGTKDYYCFHCKFTTLSKGEYKRHLETHSKVIQICQDCGFTTCSKSQLYRHRRKHKNDKKHKCPLCNYSARHNMSLIYHLKTHKSSEKEVYMCSNCDFISPVKRLVSKHKLGCSGSNNSCVYCDFTTNNRDDLKSHIDRLHKDMKNIGSNDSSVHSMDDDSTDAEDEN